MIAELTGICTRRRAGQIVLNVGGIGFAVLVPEALADELTLDEECTLFTQLVVRENEMYLVGFANASERDLFNTLVTISGVGPKLAVAIIGKLGVDNFVLAVLAKDVKGLIQVPGLGKKTAQRLLLEMETKVAKITKEMPVATPQASQPYFPAMSEAKATLLSFGCSEEEAERALESVADKLAADAEVSDIVMAAMSALG